MMKNDATKKKNLKNYEWKEANIRTWYVTWRLKNYNSCFPVKPHSSAGLNLRHLILHKHDLRDRACVRGFVLERHLLLTRSSLCFSDAGTGARWLLLECGKKTYRERCRRKLPPSGPGTRLRYWCHNVSSDEVQWIMYVRDQDIETCCYHKLILTWVICVLADFCPEVAGQCAPPLMKSGWKVWNATWISWGNSARNKTTRYVHSTLLLSKINSLDVFKRDGDPT